jgi:fatty acid desaturase
VVDFEVNAIMLVTWYWFQRWRNSHLTDWLDGVQ